MGDTDRRLSLTKLKLWFRDVNRPRSDVGDRNVDAPLHRCSMLGDGMPAATTVPHGQRRSRGCKTAILVRAFENPKICWEKRIDVSFRRTRRYGGIQDTVRRNSQLCKIINDGRKNGRRLQQRWPALPIRTNRLFCVRIMYTILFLTVSRFLLFGFSPRSNPLDRGSCA